MTFIKKLFQDLKWYNTTEFILILLFAILIPISFKYAMWGMCVLMLATLIKCITTKHVGNPLLDKWGKCGAWLIIAYLGIYFTSLLYSSDVNAGLELLSHRISLAVLSGWFLCSNLSYLDSKRRRSIFYVFTISVACLFLIRLGTNIHQIITDNASLHWGAGFDKKHHSYIALYCLTGLCFLHTEFTSYWKQLSWAQRIMNTLLIACLIAYTIITNSRAGIFCLILLGALSSFHVGVMLRKPLYGFCMLIFFITLGILIHNLMPEGQRRFTHTVTSTVELKNSTEEDATTSSTETKPEKQNDARIDIWKDAISVIKENPIIGVGVGDRDETLMARYRIRMEKEDVPRLNCHNQYLDTWVSTGILGLIILLCLMGLPIYIGWKQKNPLIVLFIIMMGASALFESILDRLIGIQVFSFFYGLLLLSRTDNNEKNKQLN